MSANREKMLSMDAFAVERSLVKRSKISFAKSLGPYLNSALFCQVEGRFIIEMMHDFPDNVSFDISMRLDLFEFIQDQGIDILDFRDRNALNFAESIHRSFANSRVFRDASSYAKLEEVGNYYYQDGITSILSREYIEKMGNEHIAADGCKHVLDSLYTHINHLFFLGIEPKSPEVCEIFKNSRGHSNRAYAAMVCGNLPKAVAFMQGSTGKEPFELDGVQTSMWQRAMDLEVMDEYEPYFKSLESKSLSHQILTELNL